MTSAKDMQKLGFNYIAGYSVEKPCMGGEGSKPAFILLKGMIGVKVARAYTIYNGHTSFEVWTKTKLQMQHALHALHTEYDWIDDKDNYDTVAKVVKQIDFESTWMAHGV